MFMYSVVPASSFDGPTDKPLDCREGFYREEPGGNCLPSCYTWLQNPKAVSITIDVVLFITAFVGFWAAVAVIVISLLRRKRMYVSQCAHDCVGVIGRQGGGKAPPPPPLFFGGGRFSQA